MLSNLVLRLASQLDAKYQRDYALYLEECDSYRRDGYRPAYCEHGTYLWRDYDVICGPCEDGLTMSDGVFRMGYAIGQAKERVAKAEEVISCLTNVRKILGDDAMRAITDIAVAEHARLMTV